MRDVRVRSITDGLKRTTVKLVPLSLGFVEGTTPERLRVFEIAEEYRLSGLVGERLDSHRVPQ